MATIRKRTLPSGKDRWQVDFFDQAGKRRAKLFTRKKDADAFLVTARAQVATGTYVHDAESISLGEAAQAWLDHCATRRDTGRRMERATFRDYDDKVRLHIKDAEVGITTIKLSRLTRKEVNEFRDRLLASGRSEAMVRKVLGVLRLILSHAMDNGQVPGNAAQGVKVLRASRIDQKVAVPSKKDVKTLIDNAVGRLRPLLIVSALCGLRASEARGLRWQDVDFADGYLHIRQRADFYCEIGEPKSAAGHRSVPAGPMVLNALREWKLACPKGEMDLVFPANDGSVSDHNNTMRRHFKPLCQRHGIQTRWHDLRHFAVSLWIEQGFGIKEVMTFAGHSSVQMTMERYGHMFPSPDHQKAMAQVEARLLG
ncbi:tyrosine-type recombinase/integrase [Magnetospirillum gryphiswaldense]|uniref:Integrase family protein n=2 Tax=Magnetospirillum gryphiswaldense TaxID=55518 RepID=V6F103_MAGGM|nr:site-specific integrase [Magnetospirillum gryphiswaldense]AVM75118.1 Putative prophage phiRv2 integrase [Magnetospirillum gryphiswaldense MSR-1]AVM79021.1 Putative prophage phiRv2 integrase [Magnetospirillum gryphiswaldense]CAM76899.1 Phage integrase [Magnetospirillum gryphiswaldense MSR-1]CDK99185.1 integrase family protein [Magnetospirillum gryphiswaldense MSR-1 v2]